MAVLMSKMEQRLDCFGQVDRLAGRTNEGLLNGGWICRLDLGAFNWRSSRSRLGRFGLAVLVLFRAKVGLRRNYKATTNAPFGIPRGGTAVGLMIGSVSHRLRFPIQHK